MAGLLATRVAGLRFDPRAALLPVAILLLVLLMVVPVPAVLLDLFFIVNIGISLIVLMVAINTRKPLDFSAFPTVLLFATLLRLALNVASTRVVLVHGHEGTAAAGHVIEAFGAFLVGGDYVVGIFVFAVLMIINLVVITKGAGRVSEVAARFTLDALPGKQMAIDADLNAGLLTADEARARRREVTTEADFHGSMDGASKFVKGDAVAGVLILAINIIGGLILGTVQHDLALADAAKVYLLLAIGDGLVAQVPALLLSIAAAMVVTRVGSEMDLAGQVTSQFSGAGNWLPVAVILALLALLPGMPWLITLPTAIGAGFIAWKLRRPDAAADAGAATVDAATTSIDWADVSDTAAASLDIGFGLVPMVDEARKAPLMARITAIRRQLSKQLGFVLPPVRVRDDLTLAPFAYRIAIGGVTVGEDMAFPDDCLAIEAGPVSATVDGRPVTDPAFGLPARWISPDDADLATAAGYTVVDAASVIGTHLNHLLSAYAHRLIGQDEVQALLDTLAESSPALAGALVPKLLPLATVTGVFQRLVEEAVPVRDTRCIVSALVANAARSTDAGELTEIIRPALGGAIVQTLAGLREPVAAIALDPALEQLLASAVRAAPGSACPFDPDLGGRVGEAVSAAAQPLIDDGRRFAIVTIPLVRRALWALLRVRLPQPVVLAFSEIPDDRSIDVVAVVGGAPVPPALTTPPRAQEPDAMDARLGLDPELYAPARLGRTDPERLVSSHMGLVRKIAWHVHGRVSSALDVEDLVQIGMVSLIEAARAFEDRGHAAFATYATMRIRGAMIDQLRKGATLVRSAMRRRREWGQMRSSLEGLLGRAATDAEMAEKLEISVEAYRAAMATTHSAQFESIDDVYSDHSDWFADDAPDALDQLQSRSMQTAIAAAVKTLPEREAMVLQLYFVEELNLEEIGQVLGVGAARVCQIKKAALGKLRGKLSGWDDD